MKNSIIAAVALVAAFAAVEACNPNEGPAEQPNVAPKVEFTIAESTLNVDVDAVVTFSATVVEGHDVTTEWFVDGEKVSTTPSVTWKFTSVGVYRVHFEAVNDLGKAEKDYTVNVAGIPLDVAFSVAEGAVEAVIGTPFEVGVTVNGGDKETVHAWTLDGADAGSGTTFSRTFTEDEIGTHTLVYHGENADGMTAGGTWTITVKDLPLEVTFTPDGDALDAMVGDKLNFAATVVHGALGAAYSWKLGENEVSTASAYSYECEAEGSYTVSCTVSNAAGEQASRSWTVTVAQKTERSLMLIDAESMTELPATDILKGNDKALSIVDNPCVSTVNPGTKVLKDDLSAATWATSGLVQVYLNHIESSERYHYTTARIKVYLGENDYLPFMVITNNNKASRPTKVNGTAFYPNHSKELWASLVKKNDWNVLEYNIVDGNYSNVAETFADITQIQFRFLVNYDNSNYPGSLSDTNTHIVYFDDIELVE
ncbi:MAG: PKD domain-containing protein [Bacteroidales bacterium]|nr:PKD domain-containing protein [Bacteroidales bacterium]